MELYRSRVLTERKPKTFGPEEIIIWNYVLSDLTVSTLSG